MPRSDAGASGGRTGEIQMGVSTGDYQSQRRHGQAISIVLRSTAVVARKAALPVFQEYGVDVAFEVIDGDEWLVQRKGQGLGVGDSNKECAG